jgi:hypothetical protein
MDKERPDFEVAPYSERKLSELLDLATENMYPTNLYTINMSGVKPSLLTLNELQAYSGVDLDSSTGANIQLGYDEIEKGLVLKTLEHPLNQQSNAKFIINRSPTTNQTGEYSCYIAIADEKYSPQGSKNGTAIDSDTVQNIISGFNISNIPHPDDEGFAMWKTNALSRCSTGWEIHEEIEFIDDIQEYSIQLINIQHDTFHYENGTGGQVKQISSIIDARNDSTDHTLRVESRMRQTDFGFSRTLKLKNLFTEIPLAEKIVNPERKLTTVSQQALLTEDNFKSFKRILEEAHAHMSTQQAS